MPNTTEGRVGRACVDIGIAVPMGGGGGAGDGGGGGGGDGGGRGDGEASARELGSRLRKRPLGSFSVLICFIRGTSEKCAASHASLSAAHESVLSK
eukprot:4603696-Pleurochrysis_carterae.AAC.2